MNICNVFLIVCFYINYSLSEVDFGESESSFNRWNQDVAELLKENAFVAPTSDIYNPCPGHATGLAGESFIELINTVILSGCLLSASCSYPPNIGDYCENKTIFDFIVVGAGTAGSVIAARLSEVSNWNVLLIEAGTNPTPVSDVPRFYNQILKTDMDWNFRTRKERGLFNGYLRRANRWPRGKVMGGTSTIGAMQYVRGSQRDFNNWAADGNIGWSWYDVLPYFKKSEDMRSLLIIKQLTSHIFHSDEGPLTLSRFTYEPSFNKILLKAAKELNYLENLDINGWNQLGFTNPNYGTIREGERLNMAKAFLNPIKSRKNLYVIKNAFVSRVLICPSTKRAYGVEYYYKDEVIPRTVKASREVILSAGTVGSTKILLLSGVGPKAEIEDIGIQVIVNLQVGRNLIDHVQFPGMPVTLDIDVKSRRSPLDILDETYEYLTRRTGPLAGIDLWQMMGYVSVDGDDDPDIRLQFLRAQSLQVTNTSNDIKQYYKNIGLEHDLFKQILKFNYDKDMILPIPVLLMPLSRGKITLRSRNPFDKPLINPSYLNEQYDVEYMIYGIRFIQKFISTTVMSEANATLKFIQYSGCCNLTQDSNEYWVCALSYLAGTAYNPVGTNKMGPSTDPRAVVDPQLRVKGIKGLRVADCSIIPTPLTGGTLAVAVMIGEKAADMIKELWIPDFVPANTMPPYPLIYKGKKKGKKNEKEKTFINIHKTNK